MEIIKFTLHGNHKDQTGNPLPKIKKTRYQYWTPQAQQYALWKEFIQRNYWQQIKKKDSIGKPFLNPKARMDIKIFWKNKRHADPENIFGAIADALFENDKNLDGSFTSQLAKDGKGKVEIEIKFL